MFDSIKHWLGQRSGDTSFDHLPVPEKLDGRRLDSVRLIVLDLETTGLNVNKDDVIAIGAIGIDNLRIQYRDQFDLILRRPELDISKTVLIHGIGNEALASGHELEDTLKRLLAWMQGSVILAFHAAFDQRFLEKTLRQTLGYTRKHEWLDVAEVLPAVFPDAQLKDGRLDSWIEHFKLDISERHNAAADAMATAELALIAFNQAARKNVVTLSELNDKVRYTRRLKHIQSQ
ncbi:MAG: DNA polymerase III subunit epsilon [Alteromonadaceae bacterium]|uniref:3'-5' exonuclease n=1 Tax=Marinobacter sp. V034 TaxID=3459610 RepID=UPI000C39B344|nr:DNA polymerase III subunit epsilon [Alteromonadaceae bacterium]MBH86473.1 DNA polymerase III subunit epsilon [Alteromonadaceae bacterium]